MNSTDGEIKIEIVLVKAEDTSSLDKEIRFLEDNVVDPLVDFYREPTVSCGDSEDHTVVASEAIVQTTVSRAEYGVDLVAQARENASAYNDLFNTLFGDRGSMALHIPNNKVKRKNGMDVSLNIRDSRIQNIDKLRVRCQLIRTNNLFQPIGPICAEHTENIADSLKVFVMQSGEQDKCTYEKVIHEHNSIFFPLQSSGDDTQKAEANFELKFYCENTCFAALDTNVVFTVEDISTINFGGILLLARRSHPVWIGEENRGGDLVMREGNFSGNRRGRSYGEREEAVQGGSDMIKMDKLVDELAYFSIKQDIILPEVLNKLALRYAELNGDLIVNHNLLESFI